MIYGIKVSKPGFDVKTAQDTNLILSSQIDSLPIALQSEISITQTSGEHDFILEHDLGFISFFMAFYKNNRNGKWLKLMSSSNGPSLHLVHSYISSWGTDNDNNFLTNPVINTDTDISCTVEFFNSTSETVTIKYILFNRGFI